ncbi:MAG: LysM peptidoglycan-binding domain-containing protein [Alphaproteobacteria bacterium]
MAKASAEETTPAQSVMDEKPAVDRLAALPPERKAPPKPKPKPEPPTFDVAEVGPDGGFVVAGRAAPGTRVRLLDGDGDVLAEGAADAEGAFAFLSERPLPEGDSLLRLEVAGPEGDWIPGAETIVVARAGGGAPLVALQTDDATLPTRVLQQPESPPAAAEATPRPEPESEETIKSSDKDLAVGTVDYDAAGRLSVKGTATPGAPVTVEVDGAPVAETKADAAGDWQATTPPGAAEGASRVGASSLSPQAEPLRVSLPFAPASLIRDFPQGRLVIVQPGNSLWRIARRAYGSGFRYTVIYAANQDQIRNPDLIYPGQILHAPKPREG